MVHFRDRPQTGRLLADALKDYKGRPGLLILALPRGGVPVAFEVARALEAPLDVLLVRKLGVPGQEELAFGAIASGGGMIINDSIVNTLGIQEEAIEDIARVETRELERREAIY